MKPAENNYDLLFNIQVSILGCDCRDLSLNDLNGIIIKLQTSRMINVTFVSRIYIIPLECSDVFIVGKFSNYESGFEYVNEIYKLFNTRLNTIAIPDYFMYPRYCSSF